MSFVHPGPSPSLARRHLLATPIVDFLAHALAAAPATGAWTIALGADLLFDAAGLALLARAVAAYRGAATRLELAIVPDADARRDLYSLQPPASFDGDALRLPAVATRAGSGASETLRIPLPSRRWPFALPAALAAPMHVSVPGALLMPVAGPFDVLFAGWIAGLAAVESRARRSPRAWLRALLPGGAGRGFARRAALAATRIARDAEVHPTAVVEGSEIRAGAVVGAHCVVRHSLIAEGARLHDGAKVEYSVVGRGSWLMHDLVLSRSVVEDGCFLIHGPYQFSLFQHRSAAFATILMDWRPDAPISAPTDAGRRAYAGPFLGSVLGEGARVLGGTLLAPGRVVPDGVWLGPDPASIHALGASGLAIGRPLAPGETRPRVSSAASG